MKDYVFMAKQTKRIIKYPIEQKIKDLHRLIVTKGDAEKIKELQADIDYFFYGIR